MKDNNFKIGDFVIKTVHHTFSLCKIEGITKAGNIEVDNQIFKPDGSLLEETSAFMYIRHATEDDVSNFRCLNKINKIKELVDNILATHIVPDDVVLDTIIKQLSTSSKLHNKE